MGVPAFYRWLSEKYSKIVVDCIEENPPKVEGELDYTAIDITSPNPNELEFDNLYIDMNGIIHPCAHPENGEAPTSEQEMYLRVMKYIDRLVAAVRPRRLLYLAIDGTAPRAKMNQQRARRFRAAQEEQERKQTEQEAREYMKLLGHSLPPPSSSWDSNVITPGTTFMSRLSKYLRFYIRNRINTNPGWKNLKVILSDASVPGEGEHKIMSFIRNQRTNKQYDPNQKHILHGLDADLIMLGLATHEPYFTILREQVLFGKEKAQISQKRKRGEFGEHDGDIEEVTPLQFLHINILREYLQIEFKELESTLPFTYDFDRVVDDFVFLCFFVGNDFLPHLPSLDIRDGALDFLLIIYKRILPTLNGYLTNSGEVNLSHVDVILGDIGKVEDEIFRRIRFKEENEKQKREFYNNRKQKREEYNTIAANAAKAQAVAITPRISSTNPMKKEEKEHTEKGHTEKENALAAQSIRRQIFESVSIPIPSLEDATYAQMPVEEAIKKKIKSEGEKKLTECRESVQDIVRLGETGWKDRYYADKYKSKDIATGGGRENVYRSYIEGLCWIMAYYYRGCASWKWFYPFHYAPFASDLINIDRFQIQFTQEQPFCPVEQLMGVLPTASKHAIPKPLQWLMEDPESPIIDFYPKDVPVDPNGKAMPWLWVVLLPFIDEDRLLDAMKPYLKELTLKEKKRNERYGKDYVYFHSSNIIASCCPKEENGTNPCLIDEKTSSELSGFLVYSPEEHIPLGATVTAPEKPAGAFDSIKNNQVIGLEIRPLEEKPHICRFLENTIPPPIVLTSDDQDIRHPRLSRNAISIVDLAYGAAGPPQRMIRNSLGLNYNQYLQGGTRNWGSLEPPTKKPHIDSSRSYNNNNGDSYYPREGATYHNNLNSNRYSFHSRGGGNSSSWHQNSHVNRGGYGNHQRGGRTYQHRSPPQWNRNFVVHEASSSSSSSQNPQSQPQPILPVFGGALLPPPPPTLDTLRAGLTRMHQEISSNRESTRGRKNYDSNNRRY